MPPNTPPRGSVKIRGLEHDGPVETINSSSDQGVVRAKQGIVYNSTQELQSSGNKRNRRKKNKKGIIDSDSKIPSPNNSLGDSSDEAEHKSIAFCEEFYAKPYVEEAVRELKDAGQLINIDTLFESIKARQSQLLYDSMSSSSLSSGYCSMSSVGTTGSWSPPASQVTDSAGQLIVSANELQTDNVSDGEEGSEQETDTESEGYDSEEDIQQKQKRKLQEAKSDLIRRIENLTIKCQMCHDARANILLLPCGHLVTCENCLMDVRRCPIPRCNKIVRGTKEVFFA